MRINAIVIALALVACGKSQPAPVATGGSGSAAGSAVAGSAAGSGKDPWVTVDAAPDTPERREARAKAALERVASIMPRLAKVRELTFDQDIPREYQSADDFKKFVHAEIAKEMPPGKADDESTALFQLGLLTKPGNLAALEEQAFTTQAGAYYDPAKKRFFLVMVPDNDLMLDTISAHELTHGLQDQHFDLQKYMAENKTPSDPAPGLRVAPPSGAPRSSGRAPVLDDDEATVRRFVAEGDATFTMFIYAAAQMMNTTKVEPKMVKAMHGQLEQFAAMSPEEMIKQNAAGFSSMDPEIKKSIDAMAEIPLTVLIPMVNSYMQGALLVADAFDRGGWKEVNALYTQPPESTEQAMHPLTKLYPTREHPKHVTLPPNAKDDTELGNVVFGELQWFVYFTLWSPAARGPASEGWGGDRASVVKRKDGRLVARIATVWDSPKDADEFAQAYVASLAKRFPDAKGDALKDGLARPGNAGKIFVKHDGARVFVVDGADDAKDLAALASGTAIK